MSVPVILSTLVSGAYTLIGQLGSGQTMSPEDGQLGLDEANLLISTAGTNRLMLYYVSIRTYALVANTADYTIGPSGATFTAARPTLIESAQINVGATAIWQPMNVLDKPKWDAILDKGSVGDIATDIYPEYTYPNAAFHVNPAPRATPSIKLGCWEELTQFASLFDIVAFPAPYQEWLKANLAIKLAPSYDQVVPQTLVDRAMKAEMAVMRINAQSLGGSLGPSQTLQSPNVGNPIAPAGAQ